MQVLADDFKESNRSEQGKECDSSVTAVVGSGSISHPRGGIDVKKPTA